MRIGCMDARRWGAQGERPGATGRASCSTKDGMGSHQQRLTQRSEFKVEQSRGITSFPTRVHFPPSPSTCTPSPKPRPRPTPTPRPRPPSSPTPPPPPSPQTSPPPPAGPRPRPLFTPSVPSSIHWIPPRNLGPGRFTATAVTPTTCAPSFRLPLSRRPRPSAASHPRR